MTRARVQRRSALWAQEKSAMSWLTVILIGWVLLSALSASGSETRAPGHDGPSRAALATMRRIAIQHNGRHKPFESFARETLIHIAGVSQLDGEDPVATVLSMIADPELWQARPLIAVPFIPLRDALGIDRKTPRISYDELVSTKKLMRMLPAIVGKQQRDEKLSMLEQETMDAYDRFVALSMLIEQRLELVPPPSAATDRTWLPILEPTGYAQAEQLRVRHAWTALLTALRSRETHAIDEAALDLGGVLRSLNPSDYPVPWRLELEVFYDWCGPFRVARALYALAALGLLLGLGRARRGAIPVGMGALWSAASVHAAGIAMRVVLGGRPPVSNFYETMLWLPFVAVVLALIVERRGRVRYFGLAASILSAIVLLLADYVPLDSSISPVVAVLHNNLWLTIHVLTIVASYGALALAAVLAHLYGWLFLRRRERAALTSLDALLYRAIQVGVVLLAGGIMLGAVWANASWGRYWGWDPKETWALITLLWFLAVLHGRSAGWIAGVGLALSTLGGFFLLLMTYYGVSFYLVGLHSYAGGHAKPVPSLLIAYLIAELAFIAWVGWSALARRRPSPPAS